MEATLLLQGQLNDTGATCNQRVSARYLLTAVFPQCDYKTI